MKVDTLQSYDRRENDFDDHAGEDFVRANFFIWWSNVRSGFGPDGPQKLAAQWRRFDKVVVRRIVSRGNPAG